jgi:hypothetical protein
MKQHLLMDDDRSHNEALKQALKLQAAKAAAGPPARLREVTRAPTGTRPQQPNATGMDDRCAGSVGTPVPFAETVGAEK